LSPAHQTVYIQTKKRCYIKRQFLTKTQIKANIQIKFKMNILLYLTAFLSFYSNVQAKTMSEMVGEAVKELKGNTAEIKTMKLHIKRLEMIHDSCEPCQSGKGSSACDCTAFEPKQDCLEFLRSGLTVNGIYRLKNDGFYSTTAYCDQKTMKGGWTVIQRRQDGSVDFNRKWMVKCGLEMKISTI